MVEVAALGAGSGFLSRPRRDIHRIDSRTILGVRVYEWVLGKQLPQIVLIHLALTQRRIEAPPAAAMCSGEAQMRR